MKSRKRDIIIALKPGRLSLILSGKKTAELRRTFPLKIEGYFPERLWLYCRGKIHGVATVDHTYEPYTNGELPPQRILKWLCITPEEYREYMKPPLKDPVVYIFKRVEAFEKPVETSLRPQSWVYAPDDFLKFFLTNAPECDTVAPL